MALPESTPSPAADGLRAGLSHSGCHGIPKGRAPLWSYTRTECIIDIRQRPPTILAYEKRPNRRDNPARCEDGRPLEPYHSGCPSALKCGILCLSAKKKRK